MRKQIVSREELSRWISEQVSSHMDCEGTKVSVQYKLREPDSDGCNWSDNVVLRPGSKVDKDTLAPLVRKAIVAARDKFNLE